MPIWLLIVIVLSVGCITSAYVTVLICKHEHESEWLIIKLKNDSIEPTDIFVCKNCHMRETINARFCKNCGSRMMNGTARHWYSNDIKI